VRVPRAVTLGLSLLLAVLLGACEEEPGAVEILASARDNLAAGQYPNAYVEVKNALQLDPDLAEGRWLLGSIHLALGNYVDAEKELRRAAELDWPAEQVRPALARALLGHVSFSAVLEIPVDGLPPRPLAQVLAAQATAALGLDRPDLAGELAAAARAADPALTAVSLAEARILSAGGDRSAALATLDSVLERDPADIEVLNLKGLMLLEDGRVKEARAAFEKAVSASGVDLVARVHRALIDIQLGDTVAAEADLAELAEVAPAHPSTKYIEGLILFSKRDLVNAIKALSQARVIAERYPLVVYYLALAHTLEGNADDAYRYAAIYFDLQPNDIRSRKILASLELDRGNAYKVEGLLQPVLDFDRGDVEAMTLMAEAHLRSGETERGFNLYRQLAHMGALAPAGETAPGGSIYLRQIPDEDIAHILDRLHAEDFDGAIAAANDYLLENAADTGAYHLLARVYLTADRVPDARGVLAKVLARDPHDPTANMMLGELALSAGKHPVARRHVEAVLDEHPKHLSALVAFIQLEVLDGKLATLQYRIEHMIEMRPEAIEPRIGLAIYHLRNGRAAEVAGALAPLSPLQHRSLRVRGLLAAADLVMAMEPETTAAMERLVRATPGSERYLYLLASAAVGTPRQVAVKEELLAIHRERPHHPRVLMGLVTLAQAEGDREQFQAYLEQLLALAINPDAPSILRMRAVAADFRGDHAEAAALAEQALSARPEDAELPRELAAYQLRAGQFDAAIGTLAPRVMKNPGDTQAHLLLADALFRSGDTARAVKQYEHALAAEPDNLVALNNLAWTLRNEDTERALKYIHRARELLPGQPDILDTIAVIEYLAGNHHRALFSIEAALQKRPGDPSMRFHRAQINAELGRTEEAIADLQELVAADPASFPEYREARALLQVIGG